MDTWKAYQKHVNSIILNGRGFKYACCNARTKGAEEKFEGMKYKQFLSFLQNMFPKAAPTLSIHSSTDEYLQYVDAHKSPYPDVIATADIQDEMSLIKDSMYDYGKLSLLTKKKQPSSINLFLSKGERDLNPEIVTYSLKKVKGGKKLNLEERFDYAKDIDHIWLKAEKI